MPFFGSSVMESPLLWANLTLGVVGLLVVGQLATKYWRDEAEFKPVLPKTQYITQDTEDSLELNTLDTLLGHYNYLIRETAAKIICDRAVNDPSTLEILLWGITREDYDERMKNLRALAVITDPSKFVLELLITNRARSSTDMILQTVSNSSTAGKRTRRW